MQQLRNLSSITNFMGIGCEESGRAVTPLLLVSLSSSSKLAKSCSLSLSEIRKLAARRLHTSDSLNDI